MEFVRWLLCQETRLPDRDDEFVQSQGALRDLYAHEDSSADEEEEEDPIEISSSSSSSSRPLAAPAEEERSPRSLNTPGTTRQSGLAAATAAHARDVEAASSSAASRSMHSTASRRSFASSDAALVEEHTEDILRSTFPNVHKAFVVFMRVSAPAIAALQVWLLVVSVRVYRLHVCEEIMQFWGFVTVTIMFYAALMHQPSRTGGLYAHRLCCCFYPIQGLPAWVPFRVKVYDCVTIVIFTEWNFFGLYLHSLAPAIPQDEPPCHDAILALHEAVKVCSVCNLAYALLMCMSEVGVARLIQLAIRRRMVRTSRAAPEGSLERNTEPIEADDPCFDEHPACSICLGDFDEDTEEESEDNVVVKTKVCGHPFHRSCLQGWLQVDRTCPLCRRDLGTVRNNTELE